MILFVWPGPTPIVALSEVRTIALDFVCLTTFQAKSRAFLSSAVGCLFVTHFGSETAEFGINFIGYSDAGNITGDKVDFDGDGDKDEADKEAFQAALVNYRDEFALSMFITTTDSSVMMFTNSDGQTLYTQKTKEVKEGDTTVTITYYELNDDYYIADDNDHRVTFNMIPVTHTLNATIYFIHVDEETPPELINAQLFLNFKVTFVAS